MKIRKTYNNVKPDLLYNVLRDFILQQGAIISENKLETYSLPGDSSSFIFRGTLTFKSQGESGKVVEDCIQGHIVGSVKGETRLMLDIDETLFSEERIAAVQDDLDFIFGSYEVKNN